MVIVFHSSIHLSIYSFIYFAKNVTGLKEVNMVDKTLKSKQKKPRNRDSKNTVHITAGHLYLTILQSEESRKPSKSKSMVTGLTAGNPYTAASPKQCVEHFVLP